MTEKIQKEDQEGKEVDSNKNIPSQSALSRNDQGILKISMVSQLAPREPVKLKINQQKAIVAQKAVKIFNEINQLSESSQQNFENKHNENEPSEQNIFKTWEERFGRMRKINLSDDQNSQREWKIDHAPNTDQSRNQKPNGLKVKNKSYDRIKKKKRQVEKNYVNNEFDYDWDDELEYQNTNKNSKNSMSFQLIPKKPRIPFGAAPYSDLNIEVL